MTGMTGGPETSPAKREVYFQKGSEAVWRLCAARGMDRQGAFFLPYLKPGMRVLDCGCRPGTITVGLARAVSPGEVVGIDVSQEDVKRAQAFAAEQGVSNTRFQVGNAYASPFPEGYFDAVFCHAVLEHLNEPVKALREMRRMLRPGGVAGVRDVDHGAMVWWPEEPASARALELYLAHWKAASGGSPFMGRRLKGLMQEAGFERVDGYASCDFFGDPEGLRAIAAGALGLSEPRYVD